MNKFLAAGIIGVSIISAPATYFSQNDQAPPSGAGHVQKHVVKKKVVVVKKQRWVRGHALPSHYRRNYVADYHRYHLRAPGPGQRWVRVDNQFILINSLSGMIAALAAAR